MYNILLDLGTNEANEKDILELATYAGSKSSTLYVYFSEIPKNVLTKLKKKRPENLVLVRTEKNSTSDEVVKDFVQNHGDTNVILIRRGAKNVDKFLLEEMMNAHASGKKIVTAKNVKDDGFWKRLFAKIRGFVVSLLFNFSLFEGRGQVVLFDKSLTRAMREVPRSIVKMTKVDNYHCVERCAIADKNYMADVKFKSKKQDLRMWLSHMFLVLLALTLTLTLIFIPALRTSIYIILMSVLILSNICVCFAFTSSFIIFRNVGELDDKDIKLKGEII